MKDVVTKSFKTINRCFSAGDEVTEADFEHSVLTIEQWKARGFIKTTGATSASATDQAPSTSTALGSKPD